MSGADVQATFEGRDWNLGLLTGHGFWVLDEDPDNGGDEALAALVAEHGALPGYVHGANRIRWSASVLLDARLFGDQ